MIELAKVIEKDGKRTTTFNTVSREVELEGEVGALEVLATRLQDLEQAFCNMVDYVSKTLPTKDSK